MHVSPQRRYASDAASAVHALMAEGRLSERRIHDAAAERRALVAGLLSTPASIAPKYFYDAKGCALFTAICELPEYYPTRTEAAIFERHRGEIVAAAGTGKQLVDLGAGDCRKAASWLPFLALVMFLVFWRSGLYAPRELREGSGRILSSLVVVCLLAAAFSIGTGHHFGTFGIFPTSLLLTAVSIALCRSWI